MSHVRRSASETAYVGAAWLRAQGVELSPLGEAVAEIIGYAWRGIYHLPSRRDGGIVIDKTEPYYGPGGVRPVSHPLKLGRVVLPTPYSPGTAAEAFERFLLAPAPEEEDRG